MERPGCQHRRLRTGGATGAGGTRPRVQVRRAAAGSARRRPAEAGGARNGRGGPARVTTKRLRGLLAHPDPPKIRRRPGRALRAAKTVSIPRPSQSTNRVGGDARRYKTRMCIYGDACPYGPGRCFFAHDAAELRPPQARWWLPEYKTKPCRYAASECPFYADGRCQYAHTVRGPASPSHGVS